MLMVVVVIVGLQPKVNMTYSELVTKVSEETNYTKREVRKLLRIVAATIHNALTGGQNVKWNTVGTFFNVPAAPHSVRNYKTGERYWTKARRRIRFKPCTTLKFGVRNSVILFQEPDVINQYLPKENADGKICSSDRPKESGTRKNSREELIK